MYIAKSHGCIFSDLNAQTLDNMVPKHRCPHCNERGFGLCRVTGFVPLISFLGISTRIILAMMYLLATQKNQ